MTLIAYVSFLLRLWFWYVYNLSARHGNPNPPFKILPTPLEQ